MEFLIDGKKVRLNPYNMRYSPLIGEGTKARVYLIGEKAYKLYKPFCDTELMTKKKIDYLKEIPTKRVILPESPILDKKRRLKGYISKYVVDFGIEKFMLKDIDITLKELEKLYDDFLTLGDYKVLVNDASYANSVFNDGIYIIDCGRFEINDSISRFNNIQMFNDYIMGSLFTTYCRINGINFSRLKQKYSDMYSQIDLVSYLEDDVGEAKNLDEYLRRKSR